MKRKLIMLSLLVISFMANGQEQPFKNGFLFFPSLLNSSNDKLFLIKEQSRPVTIEIGYLKSTGEKILSNSTDSYNNYIPKKTYKTKFPLRGIIKERNGDSMFIHFWPFDPGSDPAKGQANLVNSDDEKELYVLVIKDWKRSAKGYEIKDIPFRNQQIIAANFPVRINLSNGDVNSGFTNASISYTWVRGKARVYRTDFIEPRYRFWGFGPTIGVGTNAYKAGEEEKEEFSMTSGLSVTGSVFGVQILLSVGGEFGFNTKKVFPFLGIGVGVDLYQVVKPEIKRKE